MATNDADWRDLQEQALALARERVDAARQRLREEAIASGRGRLLPRGLPLAGAIAGGMFLLAALAALTFAWGYHSGTQAKEREMAAFIENAAGAAFKGGDDDAATPQSRTKSTTTTKSLKVR